MTRSLLTGGLAIPAALGGFSAATAQDSEDLARAQVLAQGKKKPPVSETPAPVKDTDGGDRRGAPARTVMFNDGESAFEINDRVIKSVERGLKWLAECQQEDGSWIGDVGFKLNEGYRVNEEGARRGHVGVTALAGMAFLANGQVPGRGKYGRVVEKSLDYVLANVQGNGYITANGSRMYSHAFGTLFLAEALGMSKREDLRERLEDAVRLIIDSQNQEGGWRYVPFAKESDMSITVCQVMALRAARNVGIPVPRATIDRAIQYVKDSAVHDGGIRRGWDENERGTFKYQKQNYSRATFPLTAAGVVTLYGAGVYNDRDIEAGLDYLERSLAGFTADYGTGAGRGHYFFYYGNYYAVQAMYTAGGQRWERYYNFMRDALLKMQEPDGRWPNGIGPGDTFGTAVATLILQIPYRFLPIFQR